MIVKEDIEQARSVLLPQISASGGVSISERESQQSQLVGSDVVVYDTTSNTDATSFGANLNMQLYQHDSWLRLDNAKKAAHQSDLTYQVAKQDLITRVAKAYFDLLSTKDDLFLLPRKKMPLPASLNRLNSDFLLV